MKSTFIIQGVGAVGLTLAVSLKCYSPILLGRRKQLLFFQNNELIFSYKEVENRLKIKVVDKLENLSGKVFLLSTVKMLDLNSSLNQIKGNLPKDITIILFQNGMGAEDIAKNIFPKAKIHRAIVGFGATYLNQGELFYSGGNITLSEQLPETIKNIFLSQDLIKFRQKIDMKRVIWKKLIINSIVNPLTVLLSISNQSLSKDYLNSIKKKLLDEALEVASSYGYIFNVDIRDLNRLINLKNTSSMLQDYKKGKKTSEISFINGILIQLALSNNIQIHTHQALVHLVEALFNSREYRI